MNSNFVVKRIVCNQIRCYGKIRLPSRMLLAVKQSQDPSKIPVPSNDHISKENDTNYDMKDAEREKWGTYGNKSGISLEQILPTYNEIWKENKTEEEWWPTLQQTKQEANEINKYNQNVQDERKRKIKTNMAKMPEWIAKYKENLKKEEDEMKEKEKKRQRKHEEIQELFGYEIHRRHPKFSQYLERKSEEDKLRRKKMKKDKKKQEAEKKKSQSSSGLF